MTLYSIVLFHTTSAVMRAEKLLKKPGYDIKLIPTPRQFSSDCGIALRFTGSKRAQVKAVLDDANIEYSAIHNMEMR